MKKRYLVQILTISKTIWYHGLGVCSVRFRLVCMGMANRNRIFRFMKFSTETDQNGWKTIGFGVFRFQSILVGFRFSNERVIEIFKTTLPNDKAKTKAYKITLNIDKNHKLKTFHIDHSKAKSPFT